MPNNKINNGISQKEEYNGYFKIWVGDDGIVRLKVGEKKWDYDTMERVVDSYSKVINNLAKKPKVLIDLTSSIPILSPLIRKGIVEKMKEVYNLGFEKVAMFGGSIIIKVTTTFAIGASRIKNVKHFNTEEEALKWLREE
jgi:hypothetical protein